MPGRPPKKWFRKTLKKVKRYEDGIKDPAAVVGYIWHKRLSERKKKEILGRGEGKMVKGKKGKYGKIGAPKSAKRKRWLAKIRRRK